MPYRSRMALMGRRMRRAQGRPPLFDEELVTVAFKIPRSYRDRMDEKAASLHETRSQFTTAALEAALA